MTLSHVSAAINYERVHGTLSIDICNITRRSATPLLCETKSWVTSSRSINAMELSSSTRVLVPWPKLKCCNSHDYCNANNDDNNDDDNENANTRERKAQMDQTRSAMVHETLMDSLMSTNRDTTLTLQSDRKYEDPTESADRFFRNRIRTLHIAALVLAIAALISVLTSCYVVRRFAYFFLHLPPSPHTHTHTHTHTHKL